MSTDQRKRILEELEAIQDERLEEFLREKLKFSEEAIRNSRPPHKRRRERKTTR